MKLGAAALGTAVSAALFAATLPSLAAGPDLAGRWAGTWTRDGSVLEVSFAFSKGPDGYRGSFSSDQLRVADIPISRITHDGPRVHLEIVGDATTMVFEGQLADDTLAGTFKDGEAGGTFSFVRQETAGPALLEEEVSFRNQDVSLGGTLILPGTPGPHPAIVFVHGSGAEGRWASRFLAIRFARNGFATLVFDKRGVGGSTGDWRTASFEDLAGDVQAGLALLRRHAKVDPLRMGIHGHSQGGTLAPLIAGSSPDVAFVIASAAAGLPMDEVEVYSLENSAGVSSLPPGEAADARSYARELVAVAYHGKSSEKLDSLAAAYRERPWFFPPPGRDSHYWNFSRRIAGFDPDAQWARVRVPVLLLYGQQDERVPVQPSINRITAALFGRGAGFLTVRVFPEADHGFRIRSAGTAFAWPRNAPGYLDTLISWARWVARASSRPSS